MFVALNYISCTDVPLRNYLFTNVKFIQSTTAKDLPCFA